LDPAAALGYREMGRSQDHTFLVAGSSTFIQPPGAGPWLLET
jgi:hypothetical protein